MDRGCFLGARTGANAINRLIDRRIDERNPRTLNRHMPMGLVNKSEVIVIVAISFGLLLLSASMLNFLCVLMLPFALFLFFIYSYTKRFTWTCHFVLGITCGGAPVGAWMAVTGSISWLPLVLGGANALWVAGFDIIYGSQDIEFDRKEGLYSIPAFFGLEAALTISGLLHVGTVILLLYVYYLAQFGLVYMFGLLIISLLLVKEHKMVNQDNLTNVKIASYGINQVVSVVFLIFSTLDIFLRK
jgi:4-hydroxybenzoate polyprenyltransferase